MDGRLDFLMEEDKRVQHGLESIKKVLTEKKLNIPESLRQAQLKKIPSKNISAIKLKESLQQAVESYCHEKTEFAYLTMEQINKEHSHHINLIHENAKKNKLAFKEELNAQLLQMKKEYIDTVQNAALMYREYYLAKNGKAWPGRIPQFLDIFGAFCAVNQNSTSFDLDLLHGSPLVFGHSFRQKNNNILPLPVSLDFSNISFGMLIDITNRMIEEASFHKDMDALNFLQLNLEKLLKHNPPYLKLVKGGFISYLKKIILLSDDQILLKEIQLKAKDKILLAEQKTAELVKHESEKMWQESVKLSSQVLTEMDDLKKLVLKLLDEYFQIQQNNLKAKEAHKHAADRMKKINAIYENLLYRNETYDLASLQIKISEKINELKKANEALLISGEEVEVLKNSMQEHIRELQNFLSSDVVHKFETELSSEFQKYQTLKASLISFKNECVLMSELQDVLPIFPTLAIREQHLIEDTRGMQDAEKCIRENINFLADFMEQKTTFLHMSPKKLVSVSKKLIALMQAKYAAIYESKNFIELKLIHIKEKLKNENYEPLQELMRTTQHQCALADSFHKAIDPLEQRLNEYQVKLSQEELRAKKIEKKEDSVLQLKKYIRESIMNNLSLWRVNYFGGVLLRVARKDYRVPHGMVELLMSEGKLEDPEKWVKYMIKTAKNRIALKDHWKYSIFGVRDNATRDFYQAILTHLSTKDDAFLSLKTSFEKIPGFRPAL